MQTGSPLLGPASAAVLLELRGKMHQRDKGRESGRENNVCQQLRRGEEKKRACVFDPTLHFSYQQTTLHTHAHAPCPKRLSIARGKAYVHPFAWGNDRGESKRLEG